MKIAINNKYTGIRVVENVTSVMELENNQAVINGDETIVVNFEYEVIAIMSHNQ